MQSLPISQIDSYFVNGNYPIEMLFYFENPLGTAALRKALYQLSDTFWPLFGQYENGAISSRPYNEENHFHETLYESTFDAAADTMPRWERYKDVNTAGIDSLFFLQVLQFKNGTALVPKMNHLVGDGYSYFYFLAVLAAMTQNSFIPLKKFVVRHLARPSLNRTAVKLFHFQKQKIREAKVYEKCSIVNETVAKPPILATLERLNEADDVNVSVNDYLSALVFQKTYQIQKSKISDHFTLSIPMDVRRYVPQLGPKFFGNALQFHRLAMKTVALDSMETGDLALEIRKSVPRVDSAAYARYLTDLEVEIEKHEEHALLPYEPETGCLVTNLTRMPLQKLDFGGGAPTVSFPITIGKNSAAVFAQGDDFLLRLVY